MSTRRSPVLRAALAVVSVAGLAGCATIANWRVDVHSYGSWPADRKPGTFAFDRLPSQQALGDRQARLESAALPSLQAAGFKQTDRADAQVLVQLTAQAVQTRAEGYPGNVYLRSDWWWGRHGGYWGPSLGLSFSPALYEHRVGLLMRDRASGDVLHEASGVIATYGVVESQWPILFEAALKDFPGPAISPRVVVVPSGPRPAAAASAPAAPASLPAR